MTADVRTDLAYKRTRLAFDRTLMAWTRTAVSLIGFGFSIPKFFRLLATAENTRQTLGDASMRLGLLLIAVGTLSLIGGVVQHFVMLSRLERPPRARDWLSLALLMSIAVAFVGIYAFFDILV